MEAIDISDDYSSLKNWETLRYECVDKIAQSFQYKLIPKTYTEYRKMEKLENDEDSRVEKIDSLIAGEFYKDAYDLYVEIYNETSDNAALFNAILLLEIMGQYDEALTEMTDFAKNTGSKDAINHMKRMKDQMADRDALAD